MRPVSVHIFASHPVATAQYTRVLAGDDIRLVAERDQFDIGVFDGGLPSLDAVLKIARLRQPSMRPLLLWAACDENHCLQWILRGIWGLVPYDRYEHELLRAVRQVADGQLWVPPSVVVRWMQIDAERQASDTDSSLTDREREVVTLLERRLSNKEIASLLRITERTTKFHVGNILGKLNLTSRQGLFAA